MSVFGTEDYEFCFHSVTADSIRRETIRDLILSKVMHSVQNGWQDQEHSIDMREYAKHKDELSVEMGCILWGSRVIVPSKFCRHILQDVWWPHLVCLFLFIWGFYIAFNTVQVISRRVVGRAEETSTYSSLGFCTVNC